MKTQPFTTLVLAAALLCGCATKAPTGTARISDITILSAEFGMGGHMADVTPRVVELLRTQPEGFPVNNKSLGADPLPGKKKVLTVRYSYKGTIGLFTIPGGNRMSYQSLVNNVPR